jgi:hypothetical protein
MQIQPKIARAAAIAPDEWVKAPETCKILQLGPARLYEILADLEHEDPEHIIKTFVFRSPGSTRGTRLFEANSLREFMAYRYAQAQPGSGR